jgi:hypothetical protein
MAKTLDTHLQAAGVLVTIGSLLFLVGLLAHPPETLNPQQAMAITAANAQAWRVTHMLITAGSVALAAGAVLVLGAHSRLTEAWPAAAAWAVLAVTMVVFIPVPALEATVAVDAAVVNDAATFGLVSTLVLGFVQVLGALLLALLVIALHEARGGPTKVVRAGAGLGAVLSLLALVVGLGFLWFGASNFITLVNPLLGLAFLWPIALGVGLARRSTATQYTTAGSFA